MLETNTQQKVEELVNIDRRVIGRWAKEADKTKINNCIGTRSTYKIFGTGKGWWPELEARLYQWFKEVRARGGCVSENCFKNEALVLYPIVYKNSVDTPSFCASNGWLQQNLLIIVFLRRNIQI